MADPDTTGPSPQGELTAHMAEELVRSFGLIFSNTFLYGQEHGVTTKAVADCFVTLGEGFAAAPEIAFSISDEEVLVNGAAVEHKNPLMRMFATHLSEREISAFTLVQGMTNETFQNLVELLNAKPEELKQLGGLTGAVEAVGLQNVRAKKIHYQQVTEDEVVVAKEVLEKTSEESEAVSEQIIAFLKGDVVGDDAERASQIKEAASDGEKLGDLIMRAAEVRDVGADLDGGESMANIVVGCLRKAYEGLSKDPAMNTQKGKKALGKTLMLLEEQVLKRMRDMGMEADSAEAREISEAVEEMKDELTIDSLANDYMKKRKAIEANEKRILRFIKTKGLGGIDDTALKGRLEDGGLSMGDWHELLVKSGAAGSGGPGVGFGELPAIGHLSALLERMEHLPDEGTGEGAQGGGAGGPGTGVGEGSGGGPGVGGGGMALSPGKLHEVLADVSEEVSSIVMQTQEKVKQLVHAVQEDHVIAEEIEKKAKKEGHAPKITRRKLMETLAEIAQELCQPLAVINCSVDMMMSKSLGEVTESQAEMLRLASESAEKMKQITDSLMEISGLPDTMRPDSDIQASLYTE